MFVNGNEFIKDCVMEFNVGRRYGLLGSNGCGKFMFLEVIVKCELEVFVYVDIYYLCEEVELSE